MASSQASGVKTSLVLVRLSPPLPLLYANPVAFDQRNWVSDPGPGASEPYTRVHDNAMNRHLFEVPRGIEQRARTLASTITGSSDQPLREKIPLAQAELEEMTSTLEAFNSEVAAGESLGYVGGTLITKDATKRIEFLQCCLHEL